MPSQKSLWKRDPLSSAELLPPSRPTMSPITPSPSRIRATQLSLTYDEEAVKLKSRIEDALRYTRLCFAAGDHPTAFSYFIIPADQPSEILSLLRKAANTKLATFIWGSPKTECYSVGIPPPPRNFREPEISWFAGLSRAEMRAGPIRTNADVRTAEREVAAMAERREKSEWSPNGRLKLEWEMTVVGMKRQFLGLPIEGEIEAKVVEAAMRAKGVTEVDLEEMVREDEEAEVADDPAGDEEHLPANGKKRKRGDEASGKKRKKQKVEMPEQRVQNVAAMPRRVAIKQPRTHRKG